MEEGRSRVSLLLSTACARRLRRHRRVHEGFFGDNKIATFQQYTTISADLAAKVCPMVGLSGDYKDSLLCVRADPEQCLYR
jgi:hypothetical protein